MCVTGDIDPAALSLADLRERRTSLQARDDVVSYVRRVAQARIDLVRAERARRSGDAGDMGDDLSSELREVLSDHLTGSSARPPRPTVAVDDDPLANELDAICTGHGFSRLESLEVAALGDLESALTTFERGISDDRRARYHLLDRLSAELVRRYQDGEATVDELFEE